MASFCMLSNSLAINAKKTRMNAKTAIPILNIKSRLVNTLKSTTTTIIKPITNNC